MAKHPTRAQRKQPKATLQRTRIWEKAFLTALSIYGNVRKACILAKIERSTAYRARHSDPDFEGRWLEAIEEFADTLEDEARRRAVEGTTKTIYQGGKAVGKEVVYSDRLLELLLKAARSDKYRERVGILSEDVLDAALKQAEDELARRRSAREALGKTDKAAGT